MTLNIFISHSVAPRELGVVYAIANEGAKQGATPFIPDRDWNPREEIPERIRTRLKGADCILAIATLSGFQPEWFNREVIEGKREKKPLLIIADRGIKISQKLAHIRIDRMNPAKTIRQVSERLEKFGKDKETRELLTWIGVGGLLFLLLRGGKE